MNLLRTLGRIAVTLVVVLVAGVAGWELWSYYMLAPWTRDGRVRADVISIAPDVSGLVASVNVHDNQPVHRGDVLFRIDTARPELALRDAISTVASRDAALQESKEEFDRYRSLSSIAVSQEKQQQTEAAFRGAKAAYDQAIANRDLAALNLARTQVLAPVDGVVTNMELRPGDYVTAGRGVFALIDSASLHVDGYFEETKLPRIRIGERARVHLMGESNSIDGHVESIAGGIVDRERIDVAGELANVNPTFNWVRLAQRVPVRIALDHVPADVRLVVGRTATVEIGSAGEPLVAGK
jgi:RND family efflux transporter MFP subunit